MSYILFNKNLQEKNKTSLLKSSQEIHGSEESSLLKNQTIIAAEKQSRFPLNLADGHTDISYYRVAMLLLKM